MNSFARLILAAAPLSLASLPALAQSVEFAMIPGAFSANDQSSDGRYIVGETMVGAPTYTYLLDTVTNQFTYLPLPGINAAAVSDDGRVVLGDTPDPEGLGQAVAGMWTAETGWFSLGHLPSAGACPSRSDGYELSADGSVAVGLSWINGCNGAGFVWTASTGMLPLQELANGANRASVVSADGLLIAGFAQGSGTRTPVIWNAVTTSGQLLDPPNGDVVGEIEGISADGSVLLATWNAKASKWTSAGGVQTIGAGALLSGWVGHAYGIANNGTIVGFDVLAGSGARRAWIQPRGLGSLVELQSYITSHGGTVPSGQPTQVCQSISSDGRYIIGHGGPNGAWRVTIHTCPADLDGNGIIDLSDLAILISNYGLVGTATASNGDLDGDKDVDLSDLALELASYGQSCP